MASLSIALASDLLLFITRPGVDAYGHLRDRLRWIIEETARRTERPGLGVVLIAPWKQRREADDLARLLRSGDMSSRPPIGVQCLSLLGKELAEEIRFSANMATVSEQLEQIVR